MSYNLHPDVLQEVKKRVFPVSGEARSASKIQVSLLKLYWGKVISVYPDSQKVFNDFLTYLGAHKTESGNGEDYWALSIPEKKKEHPAPHHPRKSKSHIK